MKKTLTIVFLFINFLIFAQLPILKLSNSIDTNQKLPKTLDKNEICIIYEINGGWSAYNFNRFYFINNDGKIIAYQQERPKSYLKDKVSEKAIEEIIIDDKLKEKIINVTNSTQLKELLKYQQKDFKLKSSQDPNTIPPPCMISDASGYRLTFIQNNKQSSYSYYAPKYHYEECSHKLINKPVLKKFIDVLELLSGKIYR
ncbi:hypothetical protein [Epilithonimonas hominis]|uniref:hypothetical protein n=1 Tax=Epilithonimonas hominis TaxID=420404 RepID=UPI00289E2DD1|nr:hypothetical protein [Epilithonimonas hominis]